MIAMECVHPMPRSACAKGSTPMAMHTQVCKGTQRSERPRQCALVQSCARSCPGLCVRHLGRMPKRTHGRAFIRKCCALHARTHCAHSACMHLGVHTLRLARCSVCRCIALCALLPVCFVRSVCRVCWKDLLHTSTI